MRTQLNIGKIEVQPIDNGFWAHGRLSQPSGLHGYGSTPELAKMNLQAVVRNLKAILVFDFRLQEWLLVEDKPAVRVAKKSISNEQKEAEFCLARWGIPTIK